MPRALWSGTVSFGMVAIPVTIVPALRPNRVAFNLLHDKDHSRLQRRMFCPAHNKVVHPEHIVRGVEVESEKYVVVREEELEALEPQRSQTIEITEFVDLDAIDPIYYDRAYYLAPAGADKPYALLTEALAQNKKAGVAKFVMHGREHLVAIREIDGSLALFLLHYPDEIVSPQNLAPREEKLPSGPLKKAEEVVKSLASPFRPDRLKDPYQESLQRLVKEKEKQRGTVRTPEAGEEETEEEAAEPMDLIKALERSLTAARRKRKK